MKRTPVRITLIQGSPREESYSSRLCQEVLRGCQEEARSRNVDLIETLVRPSDKDIQACIACFHCDRTGECIFRDDMPELIKLFDNSDLVLLASPIFFNGFPSTVKKMIDRCQPIWASKYMLDRPIIDREKRRLGLIIGCGGAPEYEDQFTALKTVGKMFFKTINCKLIAERTLANTDNLNLDQEEQLRQEYFQQGQKLMEKYLLPDN